MTTRPTTARPARTRCAAAFLSCAVLIALTGGGFCPPPPPTAGDIPRLRFADLLCPTVAACAPDLNNDLAVDVFDLLLYLDTWFTLEPAADLNADSTVDVFDLLQYLDTWFDGCP